MTTDEAREIYMNSDCSHFLMCTKDYIGYIEYKRLEMTKLQEDVWKMERLQSLYTEIRATGDGRLFKRLYEIAVQFRDDERLELVLEALKWLKKPMTTAQQIDIAETILGRRDLRVRSGLIYWAYDNGQKEVAILLIELVQELLDITNITKWELEKRRRKGKRICKKICEELKLELLGNSSFLV